jgi:hypothetical protein
MPAVSAIQSRDIMYDCLAKLAREAVEGRVQPDSMRPTKRRHHFIDI